MVSLPSYQSCQARNLHRADDHILVIHEPRLAPGSYQAYAGGEILTPLQLTCPIQVPRVLTTCAISGRNFNGENNGAALPKLEY